MQEELQSLSSQRLVNDPANTGNVWLRVDQLGRTVKCLTEDNAKLLEEKNILIKATALFQHERGRGEGGTEGGGRNSGEERGSVVCNTSVQFYPSIYL